MPANTKQILRDQDGYPIPQEWDATNDVYVPLPPVATETTLAAVLAKLIAGIPLDAPTLAALETIQIGNFPATQPISAASLPLPAGASTEATLAAASGKLPASLGIKADATSLSVGLSTEQRAILVALATEATQAALNTLVGAVTETAPATDTASSGVSGRLQRVAQRLTSLMGLLPSSLVGGRLDVNVGAAVLPTGAATETTLAAQSAKLPASLGLKADAASLSVGFSTEQRAILAAIATEATFSAVQGAAADAIVAAGAAGTASAKLRRLTQGVEDLKTLLVLAAGTNLIGRMHLRTPDDTANMGDATTPIQVQQAHDSPDGYQVVFNGGAYQVQRAKVSFAASGDNTLIAASGASPAGKALILSLCLVVQSAVDFYLHDAAATAIFADSTNKVRIPAGGNGLVLQPNQFGWNALGAANSAISCNLSTAVPTAGVVSYIYVA